MRDETILAAYVNRNGRLKISKSKAREIGLLCPVLDHPHFENHNFGYDLEMIFRENHLVDCPRTEADLRREKVEIYQRRQEAEQKRHEAEKERLREYTLTVRQAAVMLGIEYDDLRAIVHVIDAVQRGNGHWRLHPGTVSGIPQSPAYLTLLRHKCLLTTQHIASRMGMTDYKFLRYAEKHQFQPEYIRVFNVCGKGTWKQYLWSPEILSDNPLERTFIKKIHSKPTDNLPRLIYADWLEEQGRPADYWRRVQ